MPQKWNYWFQRYEHWNQKHLNIYKNHKQGHYISNQDG